jgi:hypothetical protein
MNQIKASAKSKSGMLCITDADPDEPQEIRRAKIAAPKIGSKALNLNIQFLHVLFFIKHKKKNGQTQIF